MFCPMGALTFDGAVRDALASAALLHSIVVLPAIMASVGYLYLYVVGEAVQVERSDESGQPGIVPILRQVLLLPSGGLDLGGIEAQDVAQELGLFVSFDEIGKLFRRIAVRQDSSGIFLILLGAFSLTLIKGGQEEDRATTGRNANGKMGSDEEFLGF